MQLRFSEDPREWRKVILAWIILAAVAVVYATWRQWLQPAMAVGLACVLGAALGLGWVRPHWFRPAYRASRRFGHFVSGVLGRVVLAVVFLLVVIPLGLVLRLAGRDLLGLRRNPKADSHWRPTRTNANFDRAF